MSLAKKAGVWYTTAGFSVGRCGGTVGTADVFA